jgi:hypothetical protein
LQAGVDGGPLVGGIQVTVDDDEGDAKILQRRDAPIVWETKQQLIQLAVQGRTDAAVAVNGLLPVRSRVQHEERLPPLPSIDVAAVSQRQFGHDKRRRLCREPAVGWRDVDTIRLGS